MAPPPPKPYVRAANKTDSEAIVDVFYRGFSNDPVFNYLGQVKKVLDEEVDIEACDNKRRFFRFLVKACFLLGGRVTVVVDPNTSDKIVTAALWLPPKKRLSPWMLSNVVRSGFIGVIRKWGLQGLKRMIIEYQPTAESKMHHAFRDKGIKTSVEDTWYLQLVATHPDYENRGLLSLIVREALAHAPDRVFTLEATTPKSRDRYTHLGFENITPITFGKGKADRQGLAASGPDANGVEIWGMVMLKEAVQRAIADGESETK